MTIGDIVKLLQEKGITADRIGNYTIKFTNRRSLVQAFDIVTDTLQGTHHVMASSRNRDGSKQYQIDIGAGAKS